MQQIDEHIWVAYTAEGIITLAGSSFYISVAYAEEETDDLITCSYHIFAQCSKRENKLNILLQKP
ncbi:MAG: hypothetical protein HUJ51_03490 [Eggerthellaceae bacterium]|nr:hypothetical protein [Eggerthellaceae bacterium]